MDIFWILFAFGKKFADNSDHLPELSFSVWLAHHQEIMFYNNGLTEKKGYSYLYLNFISHHYCFLYWWIIKARTPSGIKLFIHFWYAHRYDQICSVFK